MKKGGYKMSQVIDAAVSTIGEHGCARLVAMRRRIKSIEGDEEWQRSKNTNNKPSKTG